MDEKDERLHLGKGGMVQFGSGNVSMLVSSPDPPVIMSPAMGNTNNNKKWFKIQLRSSIACNQLFC